MPKILYRKNNVNGVFIIGTTEKSMINYIRKVLHTQFKIAYFANENSDEDMIK